MTNEFTDVERVDFVRHYMADQLIAPTVHIKFVEPNSQWNKFIDMLRADNLLEKLDPGLISRQGVMWPIPREEGGLNIFICPQIFAGYPKAEDFDNFLKMWEVKLKIAVMAFERCDQNYTDLQNLVIETLKDQGLADMFIDFPNY